MVDGTALEMRRACKGSVGSNPTLSATKNGALAAPFLVAEMAEDLEPMFDKSASADLGGGPKAARSERSEDEIQAKPVFRNPTLSASPYMGLFYCRIFSIPRYPVR